MISPIFYASNEQGRITIEEKQLFREYLATLPYRIEIIARKVRDTRTDRQHRFYFAYLAIISESNGDTVNDLHEFFKRTLLPPRFIKVMKKEIKIPASTKTLSKEAFSEYLERICAETGITIPNPQELEL